MAVVPSVTTNASPTPAQNPDTGPNAPTAGPQLAPQQGVRGPTVPKPLPPAPGPGPYDPSKYSGIYFTPPPAAAPTPPPPPAWQGSNVSPAEVSPDMQYVNAFNASIASQRKAIDNQLAASTLNLQGNRNAAAAVVAALPSEFNKNFNEATQTVNNEEKVSNTGAGKSSVGGNVNQPLITANIANTKAAGLSTVPLLNAGVTANYNSGLNQLQETAMNDNTQLSGEQANFDATMAGSTLSANASAASQAAGENWQNNERVWQDEYNSTHPTSPALTPGDEINAANDSATQARDLGYTDPGAQAKAVKEVPTWAPKIASAGPIPPPSATASQSNAYISKVSTILGRNPDPNLLSALVESGMLPPWYPGVPKNAAKY